MPPRPMRQVALFEESDAPALARLAPEVLRQLNEQMVQWMRSVALQIGKQNTEGAHEQDQR